MAMAVALGRLADLAEAQSGLVTTRQAQVLGVPRRDLARLTVSGGLDRVAHGVYRVAGAPRPRLLELRAAWMQLAPETPVDERRPDQGVVSHASATLVYQVGLLDPLHHEFSMPTGRRVRSRREDVVIHQLGIDESEVDWVEEILVTSPVRLVHDLCDVHTDGEHLAGVVADLLAKNYCGRREIARAVAPHASAYGMPDQDGARFLRYLLSRSETTR